MGQLDVSRAKTPKPSPHTYSLALFFNCLNAYCIQWLSLSSVPRYCTHFDGSVFWVYWFYMGVLGKILPGHM